MHHKFTDVHTRKIDTTLLFREKQNITVVLIQVIYIIELNQGTSKSDAICIR